MISFAVDVLASSLLLKKFVLHTSLQASFDVVELHELSTPCVVPVLLGARSKFAYVVEIWRGGQSHATHFVEQHHVQSWLVEKKGSSCRNRASELYFWYLFLALKRIPLCVWIFSKKKKLLQTGSSCFCLYCDLWFSLRTGL